MEKHDNKNNINTPTNDQLVDVLLTIKYTSTPEGLDCRPGYGGLNLVHKPNTPTPPSYSVCGVNNNQL